MKLKNKKSLITVHKVVALTFVSEKPGKEYQVNHKDGDKMNNHYFNLEWVTPKENTMHAINNNLSPYGDRVVGSKYSNETVFKALCYNEMGISTEAISRFLDIPELYLKRIFKGIKRNKERLMFKKLFMGSTTIESDHVFIDMVS